MAGSINLANVALGFDASKIVKGVEISGGELRKLNTMFQGSISSTDRYNAAMELLDKSRKSGALTADRLVQIELSLAQKYGMETEAMRATAKAVEDLGRKKEKQIAINNQLVANEKLWGDTLAHAQREMAVRQVKIEKDLNAELVLRKKLAESKKEWALDRISGSGVVAKSSDVIGGSVLGGDITRTLAQYAGMAAAFAGVKKSLSLAATAESNRISLEVLTGSAEKAKFLFDGFQELDRSSPLSRSDFSRAAQTLIGYGYAAESTLPALKQLSEVSIGNADRFQSLSLAFGQVQSQGRLMGQEVLQMVNAGFNPLQEISRTTGRSMVELKSAMADGAISADMVGDAFESATSEGGRFFEMNERLKNSAAGQFAKMKSDVELLATEIGTNLLPATKKFMDLLSAGGDGKGGGSALGGFAQLISDGAEAIMAVGEDMINPNLNAKNSKGGALAWRIQERRMTEELTNEFKHVNTKEENERIQKNMAAKADKERKEMKELADDELKLKEAAEEKLNDAREAFAEHARVLEERERKKAQEEAKEERVRDSAIREAKQHLKNEEKKDEAARKDIAKSPAGIELGSAEAAKFMADQFNAQLAESIIKPTQGEKELLEESKKQLIALQKQNAIDEKILAELKNNGFKRIR